ncbi:uncharacterized protein EURHEDRAFT_411116 [Aspergillus ruber CBS 135680]|uniref:Uncharacterized protein n=1 Tax=Aspergillus ruber (strain CBS 135680) TaxID=1388766 RepID=A0A017SIZ6_ASPRC|nr:uncharacterized protein EURHEDRAFT_411116 [Aspergillus ruber CBS 135680]EYE96609.1 hypothetical protein EURHEDRAFT_411116 [Aspergillus ruber CBS 135680]
MVVFRKLFLAEKYPLQTPGQGAATCDVGLSTTDSHYSELHDTQTCPLSPHNKIVKSSDSQLEVDRHFERIEKQLQELQGNLQKRPMSPKRPLSPKSQVPSRAPSQRTTQQSPRHVDLLEAVASSQRQQAQQPGQTSPLSPYNEDVAERNMTRFLQQQKPPRKRSIYSRFISVLSQDDVTDGNGEKNKDDFRPRSRATSMRFRNVSGGSAKPNAKGHKRASSGRSGIGLKENKTANPSVQEVSQPVTSPRETQTRDRPRLRTQRSAPNLTTEQLGSPPKGPAPSPAGHLSVPPAHKQGDSWSNTPIPDSPTLPTPAKSVKKPSPDRETPSTMDRCPSTTSRNYSLPARPTPSRKNTLNLSIDTNLATRGKQGKASHRAIQPPTPSSCDMKCNPSIAEVMNSPLPSATPTSLSPLSSANPKVAEIMDMFRQAYTSTKAISPHPTFETLQDAIVREINFHEAFQRVPVPEQGPAFTPSPRRESFDRAPKPPKTAASGKDSQFSKFKPASFMKHRRSSAARTSISTSVPSKVMGRVSTSGSRRRHTDAPPPSPSLLDTPDLPQELSNEMPPVYTDIPLRSQTTSPGVSNKKRSVSISKDLAPSQSVNTLSSYGSSSNTAPSVYCLRAQTSASSNEERNSNFSDDGDGDDDVLHLPSPGFVEPHQKKYGAASGNAYRMMNWQTSSTRNVISPCSSNRGYWAREMHSVETY